MGTRRNGTHVASTGRIFILSAADVTILVGAFRADAEQFNPATEDSIAAEMIRCPLGKVKWQGGNILHTAATHASEMVMCGGIPVKTGLAASHVQFLDLARLGQQFQVPIDRSETDLGQPPSDELVKRRRRWVRSQLPEFFQDDLSLSGVALTDFGVHWLTTNSNYYC